MIGISSVGLYLPKYRIKIEEIARVWKKDPQEIFLGLGIKEKCVANIDEDTATLAIEASLNCLANYPYKTQIEALFVGSESHPYAVNPTSTIVGEFLGIGNHYLAADLSFACKAGTAGIQTGLGMIGSGQATQVLAVGSDCAQSKPHDVLEYASSAAAVAILLGSKNIIAKLINMTSFSTNTWDFWRREGVKFPSHAGRFSGEPAYFYHITETAKNLLIKTKSKPKDYQYCVFHMPNGKFPLSIAKRLGFSLEQISPSLVAPEIGNPYTASALMGLAKVLEIAKNEEKIFMVSYGSGAGSDGFVWEVAANIKKYQKMTAKNKNGYAEQLNRKEYIDYSQYLRLTKKI